MTSKEVACSMEDIVSVCQDLDCHYFLIFFVSTSTNTESKTMVRIYNINKLHKQLLGFGKILKKLWLPFFVCFVLCVV